MTRHYSAVASGGLLLIAYLLCLPLTVVWFIFWMILGSIIQPPDRLANRYYRLAVWPLLLPICLLPGRLPPEANMQPASLDDTASDPAVAGIYG